MDIDTFIHQRQPQWRQLEAFLKLVEGSGLAALEEAQAVDFGRLYRCAASDLNQAQTFVRGDATVQYLNDLVARCYLIIHAAGRTDVRALPRYLFWGYPAVFRRHSGALLLATALFAAGTLFGFLAAYFDRESRVYLLPPEMSMIQPDSDSERAPPMTSGQLAGFSSFLFANNVGVSLFAFALGMTLGVGTTWLMFSNGLLMGALGAVFVEAGQFPAYCTGILPHGVLEIPAVLIGGGAGFVLARGILRARPWPRREELADASTEALKLVGGCVPLLAVAALLEAGVARAPDWLLGGGLKLAVAGVFGLLFAAYIGLLGWKGRAAQA